MVLNLESNEIVIIPIDHLHALEEPLRRYGKIADEQLDLFGRSIVEHGLFHPILVIRKERTENQFRVIAGCTRLEAARMAGVKELECRILDVDQAEAAFIALSENTYRREVHPIDLAFALQNILKQGVYQTQDQLSKALGWSGRSRVSQYLEITRLPQEVLDLFLERQKCDHWQVTERHLRSLVRLNSEKDKREDLLCLARRMIADRLPASKVEAAVESILSADENGHQKKQRSHPVEIPGMPPNTAAEVSPGKLILKIRFENAESWSTRWDAVADIFGTIGFDPSYFLHESDNSGAFPLPVDQTTRSLATTEKKER